MGVEKRKGIINRILATIIQSEYLLGVVSAKSSFVCVGSGFDKVLAHDFFIFGIESCYISKFDIFNCCLC